MSGAISVRGIDHVVIRCRDLDAMLRFYCDALGCAVEKRNDRIGLVHVRAGRSQIDLVPIDGELGRAGGAPPGVDGRNMDHFCLQVEPFDAQAIAAQLQRFGIAASEVKQRFGALGDGPSIYIEDPEGNTVELKGPPAPR